MKNIDLREFRGKDILVLLKKADELFIGNLEEKIHSHKIYNNVLEQIPIDYENTKLRALRGNLRQKIWNCERSFFWNENFASQSGQDKIIKNSFLDQKKTVILLKLVHLMVFLEATVYILKNQ